MRARQPAALDGSFEQKGRNPLAAALILVFVLGSLYFAVGGLVEAIAMYGPEIAKILHGKASLVSFVGRRGEGYLDTLARIYHDYRGLILGTTVVFQFVMFFFFGTRLVRRWFSSTVGRFMRYDSFRGAAVGIVAAILILPFADAVSWATDKLFPVFSQLGQAETALYRWGNPLEMVLIIFAISITPAVCEEALFRGILQRSLQRRMAFPWSIILSGTIFALYHQSPLGLAALVPVGILLGFLYWSFDSIWPGMLCHATYNGLILLLANNPTCLPSALSDGSFFRPWVWLAGGLGLILFCLLIGRRALSRKGRGAEDQPPAAASQG
jgi:membrane protease YdiL (CAAX protease family)